MAIDFFVNIGTPDAGSYGVDSLAGGAIANALYWRSTARMDRAGSIEFALPASDAKSALVQPLRVARAYARIGGAWQQMAAGIIERVERRLGLDGSVEIVASGPDLLGELGPRVPLISLDWTGSGAGVYLSTALAALGTASGAWNFYIAGTPPQQTVYGAPALDSILATMVAMAKRTYTHFYAVPGQRIAYFTPDWAASGVRAVGAGPGGQAGLAAETAAITALRQVDDAGAVVTEIRPFGAGNAEARLTIAATTRTAPTGYGVRSDSRGRSIYSAAAESAYGQGLRTAVRQWTDITPLSSTTADMQTAANALFDEALLWLKQHEAPQRFYELEVAGASVLLRPMQTIRVVYRDPDQGIAIDEDLLILEATTEITPDGVQTVGLTVATVDRWPDSDVGELVGRLAQAQIYAAQPQLNANSYVIPFSKNVDQTETADFRFRFDADVWQLARVTFDFQLLPLESTVKSVGASSSTTSSGGDTTATSSSGGGTTATSSSGGGTTATSSSTNDVAQTSTSGGGAYITSNSGGAATVTSASGGGATKTTTNGDKSHLHTITLLDGQPGQLVFYSDGALYSPTGGTRTVNSNFANVVHSHSVDVPSHSHDVSVPSHSHDVSVPSHSHSVTVPGHNHTVTVAAHTHTVTVAAHTHTVTVAAHTHTVTPTINTVYGIYRDSTSNVFGLADLEYSLDGSTWFGFAVGVNGFANLGDGWTRVDLTALLQEAGTLRPASANNLLRIRRKSTGATGKMATIDAQLNVRNIIQAVALA